MIPIVVIWPVVTVTIVAQRKGAGGRDLLGWGRRRGSGTAAAGGGDGGGEETEWVVGRGGGESRWGKGLGQPY